MTDNVTGSSYEHALLLAAIAGFSTFIGAALPIM